MWRVFLSSLQKSQYLTPVLRLSITSPSSFFLSSPLPLTSLLSGCWFLTIPRKIDRGRKVGDGRERTVWEEKAEQREERVKERRGRVTDGPKEERAAGFSTAAELSIWQLYTQSSVCVSVWYWISCAFAGSHTDFMLIIDPYRGSVEQILKFLTFY